MEFSSFSVSRMIEDTKRKLIGVDLLIMELISRQYIQSP